MDHRGTAAVQNIRSTIERANAKFMDVYRRGDAAGMARLYTTGGQVLPPNG